MRSSAGPILQILGRLDAAAAAAAWNDMRERLRAFDTADGWEGPNELLLTAGAAPRRHEPLNPATSTRTHAALGASCAPARRARRAGHAVVRRRHAAAASRCASCAAGRPAASPTW